MKSQLLALGRHYIMISFTLMILVIVTLLTLPALATEESVVRNGFILKDPLIPINEIYSGGPPRDGIPSLDEPIFDTDIEKTYLLPEDKVIGVFLNGVAKAYPILIMNYHELVNDQFDGQPVTISYCPLCGTGMAFDPHVEGDALNFGVSGLLYNSDLLMYDHNTDSLWSQIEGRAISGAHKGKVLDRIPVEHTTWRLWRQRYPDTLVLSHKTGFSRNYGVNPYPYYEDSGRLLFPLSNYDRRYPAKTLVIGIEVDGSYKAYPFVELAKNEQPLVEQFQGKKITIEYHAGDSSARILDQNNEVMTSVTAYWFAWMAFHPDSEVYSFER